MSPRFINERLYRCNSVRVSIFIYILIWQLSLIAGIVISGISEKEDNTLSADTHLIETTRLISSEAFLPQQSSTNKINQTLSYHYSIAVLAFSPDSFIKQNYLASLSNLTEKYKPAGPFLNRLIPRSPPPGISSFI